MIESVSDISDMPPEIVEIYRQMGFSDEEIVENFTDAVDYLNSCIHCCEPDEDFRLEWIFSD